MVSGEEMMLTWKAWSDHHRGTATHGTLSKSNWEVEVCLETYLHYKSMRFQLRVKPTHPEKNTDYEQRELPDWILMRRECNAVTLEFM